MLLAAALPFALVLGGVGTWGVAQKHKAESYAAAIQAKDAELQRLAAANRVLTVPAATTLAPVPSLGQMASRAPRKHKGMELIIPVERSPQPLLNDTQQVKGH